MNNKALTKSMSTVLSKLEEDGWIEINKNLNRDAVAAVIVRELFKRPFSEVMDFLFGEDIYT